MNNSLLRFVAIFAASSLFSGMVLAQTVSWQAIPGTATDIGVGADGDAWVIGNDCDGGNNCGIYHLVNGNWSKVPGAARRIDVGPNGPWVANGSGGIYRWNGRAWDQMPGAAWDIGVGASGAVWVIGTVAEGGGYGIYRWNAARSNWDKIAGSAVRIDVDPKGNAWVVTGGNAIFRFNGSAFVQVPGAAIDIGIGGDGSVWIVGTDHGVSRWNGSGWTKTGGQLTNISVDGKGNPWGVNDAHNILASNWQPAIHETPPPPLALAANGAESLTVNQWVARGNYMLSPGKKSIGILGNEGRFCVYEAQSSAPASLANHMVQPSSCMGAKILVLNPSQPLPVHMRLFQDGSLCIVGGDKPSDPPAGKLACTHMGTWIAGKLSEIAPVAKMPDVASAGITVWSREQPIDSFVTFGKPEPFPATLFLTANNPPLRLTASVVGAPATASVTCPATCRLQAALGDTVEIRTDRPPVQWGGNCARENLVAPPASPPNAAAPSCRLKMDADKAAQAF